MLRICFSLFITGIIVASGPCLASCGPILVSYVAGTKKSTLGGLRSWFIFSISRVAVYVILGTIAGFAGAGLFKRFYWELPGYIIWFMTGGFISSLGILIFLGKETHFRFCKIMNESLIQKDTASLIAMGVLIGIFPCVPLIGVFSYITMISTHFSQGIAMSAAFGLGTLFSPLIFLGMFAGTLPKFKILQNERALRIFQKISGILLFSLGAHIIIKTIIEYVKLK